MTVRRRDLGIPAVPRSKTCVGWQHAVIASFRAKNGGNNSAITAAEQRGNSKYQSENCYMQRSNRNSMRPPSCAGAGKLQYSVTQWWAYATFNPDLLTLPTLYHI